MLLDESPPANRSRFTAKSSQDFANYTFGWDAENFVAWRKAPGARAPDHVLLDLACPDGYTEDMHPMAAWADGLCREVSQLTIKQWRLEETMRDKMQKGKLWQSVDKKLWLAFRKDRHPLVILFQRQDAEVDGDNACLFFFFKKKKERRRSSSSRSPSKTSLIQPSRLDENLKHIPHEHFEYTS